jgi:hypothetical protein
VLCKRIPHFVFFCFFFFFSRREFETQRKKNQIGSPHFVFGCSEVVVVVVVVVSAENSTARRLLAWQPH